MARREHRGVHADSRAADALVPVERPEELFRLGDSNNCCVNSGLQGNYALFSTRLYQHLRESTASEFSEIAGFQANTGALGVRRAGAAGTESIPACYCDLLPDVRRKAGRRALFVPDDDQ
jgi:hypothetical protein